MEKEQTIELKNGKFGTGCIEDPIDERDRKYDDFCTGKIKIDWVKGYNVEEDLDIKIIRKNQGSSGSCVGQGISYYVGVINAVEIGKYDEVSAKAVYSQIQLGYTSGGAYIRDGMKLICDWGSVLEQKVLSYESFTTQDIDGPRTIMNLPTELFMKDKSWKTPEMDQLAKILQAKEYRVISASTNMELFAHAILNNHGVVGGVRGENNGTWGTLEPKPPINPDWGHCIYFGKFGTDRLGKYIATPNSWGDKGVDELHPDGWQKLREDYFASGHMFNPWTLLDRPNVENYSNVKVIKDINSPAVGFWCPANSPDGLISMARNYGIDILKNDDGTVDWNSTIQGTVNLK